MRPRSVNMPGPEGRRAIRHLAGKFFVKRLAEFVAAPDVTQDTYKINAENSELAEYIRISIVVKKFQKMCPTVGIAIQHIVI